MTKMKWFESSFRRCLVDMHIEDWDERFLSLYDPARNVRLLQAAQVQSAMVYANSHVGLCYWPTTSGQMHRGLKGQDVLGEYVALCRAAKIDVILYYTLVFNNWAYDHDASWRCVTADGRQSRDEGVAVLTATHGRYGVCCPNSPGYRGFVKEQIDELCGRYRADGFFFDMTFWPFVCYCPACRKRFRDEEGTEAPERIDWRDPLWTLFQRSREGWLSDFAGFVTGAVRANDPALSVEHQSSTFPFDWSAAVSEGLIEHNDYLGGDFYGGLLQQSFICKLYHNLTPNPPFEFMTSRCSPDLRDHSSMKQPELLALQAAITLAHGGAFLFIDAIDPIGTLNQRVYEALGTIFAYTKDFEPFLGGELRQDIAIYFSMRSKLDPADNGRPVGASTTRIPHLDAVVGAARVLKENHVPFGVIGKPNLAKLSRHQVLALPDLQFLDAEEMQSIRTFVEEGGSLYASGGEVPPELLEWLGVTLQGATHGGITYIAPTPSGQSLMPETTPEYPLSIWGPQAKAAPQTQGEVLATITLPFTAPTDRSRFASIHSNPPGITTTHPAIFRRKIGKGTAIWVSAALEKGEQHANGQVFLNLIASLAAAPLSFVVDAPPAVEAVLFEQHDRRRFVLSLVNEQDLLPPVRATGMRVKIHVGARRAAEAVLVPKSRKLAFAQKDGYVELRIPPFDVLTMVAITFAQPRAMRGKEGKRGGTTALRSSSSQPRKGART